ncbi:MAG: hypothetical protein ABIV47_21285 [Roseiflexaceae bacterium]
MSNRSQLSRWSGLASMLGGLLFAIAIALHPLRHGEAVNASSYSAIHVLGAVALMLILFGLVGLYICQAEQLGTLGLYSFLLAFIGNVLTYGGLLSEGFLWPAVGLYDPAAVHSFDPNVVGARGSSLLPLIFFVGLAFFALGYALFGRALIRAGVLPRWGGVLIAIGAVLYVVGGFSLPLFGPESPLVTFIETSGAIPFGLGFIWLGYTLWSGASIRRAVLERVQ